MSAMLSILAENMVSPGSAAVLLRVRIQRGPQRRPSYSVQAMFSDCLLTRFDLTASQPLGRTRFCRCRNKRFTSMNQKLQTQRRAWLASFCRRMTKSDSSPELFAGS